MMENLSLKILFAFGGAVSKNERMPSMIWSDFLERTQLIFF